MKTFYRLICQMLILSMVWLPYSAQAGMIATDQVLASATNEANRDKVRDFVSRTDVQKQFQTLGLTASTAEERVNAMTQEEINRVAGKIDTLPAGAASSTVWWVVGVLLIAGVIWYYWK